MRRLDLTDYDPEPAPRRTCRPCLYGRHPDCYAVRDGSTANGLTVAVDTLLADAGRLGIELIGDPIHGPQLYYWGDGEAKDYPPPAGWREILAAEAERIGWQPAYLPSRQEGVAR